VLTLDEVAAPGDDATTYPTHAERISALLADPLQIRSGIFAGAFGSIVFDSALQPSAPNHAQVSPWPQSPLQ
jgi:hypothetical protein